LQDASVQVPLSQELAAFAREQLTPHAPQLLKL
jgi:hypothetical protein